MVTILIILGIFIYCIIGRIISNWMIKRLGDYYEDIRLHITILWPFVLIMMIANEIGDLINKND